MTKAESPPIDAYPRRFAARVVAVAIVLAVVVGCGDTSSPPPRRCNGHAELCNRPFDQVAFAGAHNAMSNADDGWLLPNQQHGLANQLEQGVREFLIDTHEWQGRTWLCHEYCELGNIPLIEALGIFREFMDTHPDEVLAFSIQEGISNAATEAAFIESGLVKYVYTHPVGEPWPTLGQMIDDGTRLLVMTEGSGPPPAWYQPEFELSWDTPYFFTSPAEFSCEPFRGSPKNPLFEVNHWLSTPFSSPENAAQVNVYDVLWPRVEKCREESGRIPNFVAVDFVSIGDLMRVVDRLNGV